MQNKKHNIIYCNNADVVKNIKKKDTDIHFLNYDNISSSKNIEIKLSRFVSDVNYIPDRVKDLLEIACYIYCADRRISRGSSYSVEFQNWSRKFHFIIKVRDIDFWNKEEVKVSLKEVLEFMSGDKSFDFTFQSGQTKDPMGLFDSEECKSHNDKNTSVVLFSGGLDSLAGILERLSSNEEKLCLVSHLSGQPSTKKTQKAILDYLNKHYDNRCNWYKLSCNLLKFRPPEETQRTRSFLFCSIAYAISNANSLNRFYCYENGITSINLKIRTDLLNSRASRTTHPKTIGMLKKLFTLIDDKEFFIDTPFFEKTKTDIVNRIVDLGHGDIINSTVSCSKSSKTSENFTHCGKCSQCIERRFAIFSNNNEKYDYGVYDFDFTKDAIDNNTFKSGIIDFLRLAVKISNLSIDSFLNEYFEQFIDIEDYLCGQDQEEKAKIFFDLFQRNSSQIKNAINNLRFLYDSPYSEKTPDFFKIISEKIYFKEPINLLIDEITKKLSHSIPVAFKTSKPNNENSFNDFVNSIIESEKNNYNREYPTIYFAKSKSVPDHSIENNYILIESKYIREGTSPSKITEGISADITKYKNLGHILFVVYDPNRNIVDDKRFASDFETMGNCSVKIFR